MTTSADDTNPTAAETAAELGLTARALGTLREVGLVSATPEGTALRYERAEVDALKRRSAPPDDAPTALIVRLGVGRFDKGEKRWVGWRSGWPDERRADAARRWWRIAQPESYTGRALVAVIGEWVVDVWSITGGRSLRGMSEFHLSNANEEQVAAYSDKRIKLGPGPVVMRFPG